MMKVENGMSVKSLRDCCLRAAVFTLAVSSVADVFAAVERNPIVFPVRRNVEIKFLPCPEGSFVMGKEDGGKPKCCTKKHKVTITRPFWLSEYKITREQWDVLGRSVNKLKNKLKKRKSSKKDAPFNNVPVVKVSYRDVNLLCDHLTKRHRSKLPKGYVVRLPTEAEWEYALKANSSDTKDPYVRFLYGSYAERCEAAKQIEIQYEDYEKWVSEYSDAKKVDKDEKKHIMKHALIPVGFRKPNSWGFYDMIGNGGEMMLDTVCQLQKEKEDDGCIYPLRWGSRIEYLDEETDPLRLSDAEYTACIVRGLSYGYEVKDPYEKVTYPVKVSYDKHYTFRLCIGPNLIKEKKTEKVKAKAAKKKQ